MKKLLFTIALFLIATPAFGAPPDHFTNGETFTIQCSGTSQIVYLAPEQAGSGLALFPFNYPDGLTCGQSFTFSDVPPATSYSWEEKVTPAGNSQYQVYGIPYVAPVSTPAPVLWSGTNGFWGSTTASDITGVIQASVIKSGINIYPLLTYVGIPVLFAIAGLLIFFINRTLTPVPTVVKRKRGRPRKDNFIYHSAEDLAFKQDYGKEK